MDYDEKIIGIRHIIKEVRNKGFKVSYESKNSKKVDIRETVNKEAIKYRNKFYLCMFLQFPIIVLIWFIPFYERSFLT